MQFFQKHLPQIKAKACTIEGICVLTFSKLNLIFTHLHSE